MMEQEQDYDKWYEKDGHLVRPSDYVDGVYVREIWGRGATPSLTVMYGAPYMKKPVWDYTSESQGFMTRVYWEDPDGTNHSEMRSATINEALLLITGIPYAQALVNSWADHRRERGMEPHENLKPDVAREIGGRAIALADKLLMRHYAQGTRQLDAVREALQPK